MTSVKNLFLSIDVPHNQAYHWTASHPTEGVGRKQRWHGERLKILSQEALNILVEDKWKVRL